MKQLTGINVNEKEVSRNNFIKETSRTKVANQFLAHLSTQKFLFLKLQHPLYAPVYPDNSQGELLGTFKKWNN